jgi:hypothetical protein
VLDEARNVGELHRSLHLGMRCENLLEQRRARPRQADDEDRLAVRLAARAASTASGLE